MTTRFITPTAAHIAVRDILMDIARLDERDAINMMTSRLDEVTVMIGTGNTPLEVAGFIHMESIIGLSMEEMVVVREGRTDEQYLIALRELSGYRRYALKSVNREGKAVFYTGRAGSAWVSEDAAETFYYTQQDAALARATQFNKFSKLHGAEFMVVEG